MKSSYPTVMRRALRGLALGALLAGTAGCQTVTRLSQAPAVVGGAALDRMRQALDQEAPSTIDVLYATDRAPHEEASGQRSYDHLRSKSLAFGSCVVELGNNMPWKSLIDKSAFARQALNIPLSIKSIRELRRFPETPFPLVRAGDEPAFAPDVVADFDASAKEVQNEVALRLGKTPKKDVYLFIHGYNNSLSDAAFTMAEIWHFLGHEGVPMIYSWPAGVGGLRGYTYDRESGEFTNYHLKQFIKVLAGTPGLEHIHIIAHSRGTDVTTTALRELIIESRAAGRDPRTEFRISNLVLAAPDMDFEVVSQRVIAERLFRNIGRTTLYVSSYDRAIGFSDWLFQGITRLGRLGRDDLTETMRDGMDLVGNVDVIDVAARTDFLGHAYFHTNPYVSADLVLMLRDNKNAGAEHGRPLKSIAPHFWVLQNGYPGGGKTDAAPAQ